ncbi:MAG: imidazole glycerol phosphate synthase subunit HisH [Novosphingobium sp.]
MRAAFRLEFLMHLSVIDAGLGNIKSIVRMVEHIGGTASLVSNPAHLADAEALLLPGVGHYDYGMKLLNEGGWIAPLNEAALGRRVPVLGICLGMQLMCRGSEEGSTPGLGWIAADVRRIDTGGDPRLKVPHIGWAATTVERAHDILPEQEQELRYYYVHSYRMVCDDPADVLCSADYGTRFHSGFARDNLRGVQFHPEKSHRFGMELFRRFLGLTA